MKTASLTVALPKGRLLSEAVALFGKAGMDLSEALESEANRRLVIEGDPRILTIRPHDVPTYVAQGAADFGVVGNDVLREQESLVYEPLDLKIGVCRLVIAGTPQFREHLEKGMLEHRSGLRVATSYPHIARRWLEKRGLDMRILPLRGSVEIAPLTGFADCIVDLVSSGKTLRQNGLVEIDTLLKVSGRLIVNRAALKTVSGMARLIDSIKSVVEESA